MTALSPFPSQTTAESLQQLLDAQKKAFLTNPMPSAQERIDNLDKLHNAIVIYKDRLVAAINDDFGNRSTAETLLAEYFAALEAIDFNRKRVKKWMKVERRHVPQTVAPGSVKLMYQPLGVIGIIVPWNLPFFLGISPLISSLAAGNRAMIKTSEFAPETSKVVKAMIESIFSEDEVAVVEGDVEVSTAFSALPFDHLVFTGATSVGKIVMAAAAKNLTPVTLELGGKSPVLIHHDFPIKEAASRIAFGKALNCGQVCVAPDYVLLPENQAEKFAYEFASVIKKRYPTIKDNQDYTSIINERQYNRLKSYLDDAVEKGAKLIEINPADENFEGTRKMPMTLVLNVTDDMLVMQEEIFGPILPIRTYKNVDEGVDYINANPRPLGLYYFDWDKARADSIVERTHSGAVAINDTMVQGNCDDIPFGGIGPSGMGHYHGREGFVNFSKAKGIVRKGKINSSDFVAPPWNNFMFRMLTKLMTLKFRKRS